MLLPDEALRDTEGFIGCYAVYNGIIGLSFKTLPRPIEIQIGKQPYTCQPGTFQPLQMPSEINSRIRLAIDIWQTQSELLALESDPATDPAEIDAVRGQLNSVYDLFVERYGYLADNAHLFTFEDITDVRLFMLQALEEKKTLAKADIFFTRTRFPAMLSEGQLFFDEELEDSLPKALYKCLDETGGKINIERIAELAGTTAAIAEQILLELELVYPDPIFPEQGGHRGVV